MTSNEIQVGSHIYHADKFGTEFIVTNVEPSEGMTIVDVDFFPLLFGVAPIKVKFQSGQDVGTRVRTFEPHAVFYLDRTKAISAHIKKLEEDIAKLNSELRVATVNLVEFTRKPHPTLDMATPEYQEYVSNESLYDCGIPDEPGMENWPLPPWV